MSRLGRLDVILAVGLTALLVLSSMVQEAVAIVHSVTITKSAAAAIDFVGCSADARGDSFYFCVGGTTVSNLIYNKYNITTGALIASYDLDAIAGQGDVIASDIWCSETDCYVSTIMSPAATTSARIWKVNFTGGGFVNFNAAADSNDFHTLTGRDVYGDGATVILYASQELDAGFPTGADKLIQVDGASMGLTANLFTAVSNIVDIKWSGNQGSENDVLVSSSTSLYVYDLSTSALQCTIAVGGSAGNIENQWYNFPSVWVAVGTTVKHYNPLTCAADPTRDVTAAISGLTGSIRSIETAGFAGNNDLVMLVQEGGSNARVSVVELGTGGDFNLIPHDGVVYDVYPASSQNAFLGDFSKFYFTSSNSYNVMIPLTGTDRKFAIVNILPGSGVSGLPSVTCQDTDGDGFLDTCDGEPLEQFPLVGNLTTKASNFFVAFTGVPVGTALQLAGLVPPMSLILMIGVLQGKYDVKVPGFAYGLMFLGGVAVSVALTWWEPIWLLLGILGFAASFAIKAKDWF